ncbi:MAG: PKD domain-containing protein [Fulvivirga sp.]
MKKVKSIVTFLLLSFTSFFVYGVNPTVTINQAASQIDPTNSSPIVFDVVFSEAVSGFDSDADLNFSSSTTGGTLSAVITEVAPMDGTTYSVSVSGMAGPGDLIVNVVAGAATAVAAPNDPNLISTSTDNTITYGINPSVNIDQNVLQSDPATTTPILFIATFSEPVSGFNNDSNITFGGTAGGSLSAVVSETLPMDGTTYSINVSGMTTSGTVTIDLDAGAAQAIASPNTNSLASSSIDNSVTYHATPSVTVSKSASQPDPTTETAINFTAVFSEAVSSFSDDTNITFGGTATGALTGTVTEIAPNDGTTYDIEVTGMTSVGTVTVTLDAGAGTATTGNQPSTASNTASVTFESPAPTVTINQAVGQLDPTNDFPIEFTVVFSDPVTGFDDVANDITDNSTATGLVGSITQNSSTNYTVSVTAADAAQDADIILSIPAGAAQRIDGLGNDNVASTSTDNTVRYDDVNPTVNTFNPADDASDISVTLNSITITFDEDIRLDVGSISDNSDRIRIRDNSSNILVIDKDSPLIFINNNVATIDISGATFNSNTDYNIRIGSDVFEDLVGSDGNNFAGFDNNSTWNFTTVGLGVNGPNAILCIGADYVEIGDITISEAAKGDFSSGIDQTLVLTIPSGFEFEPGIGNVSVSGADISNASLAVSSTKIFLSYDIDGGSNNPVDEIVISGIKAKALSGPTSGDILRTGGDAVQSGNSVGDAESHGILSSANGDLVFSNDAISNTICLGEAVEFTASATGATNYELFIDGVSAGANGSGVFSGITTISDGQEISVVATGGNCTETGSVVFTVNDLPVVDAGSPQTICSGEILTLGGSPTLIDATGATPYTYNWTGTGMTAPEQVKANPQITAPNPGASDQVNNYTVTVTDANNCTSVIDDVDITVKNISQTVTIAQPTQTTFAVSEDPVAMEGLPVGGTFSGPGVTLLGDNSYQFDPEAAGTTNSPHTVFYTTTLDNGCEKSTSRNITVAETTSVINNLANKYCNNEGLAGPLSVTPAFQSQIEAFINNWNTNYVVFYGYSPLAPFNPADQNFKNSYGSGVERINGNYYFNPQNITKPCPSCDYAYVGVYLKFANPAFTVPYNTPEFLYSGQFVNVNPVPNPSFTGLASDLSTTSNFCRVDEEYILTGNLTAGVWEIGFEGANFQAANATGVNGLSSTDGTQAIFNPGNVSQNGQWTIRYSLDPGTLGSNNQPCEGEFIRNIQVNGLPPVSFNEGASQVEEGEEFCYDSPSEIIVGSQTSGNIMFSGYGVSFNSGTGQAIFNPTAAIDQYEFDNNTTVSAPQNFEITFSFRNSNECINSVVRNVTVYPLPAASFSFSKKDLCYSDPSELLDATQPQGKFFLTYPDASTEEVATNQDFTFDPAAQFDEAVSRGHNPLDAASFNVEWRVQTDIDGGNKTCFNSQFETFTVTPLETVTMAGIADGATFCSNENDIEITLSPFIPNNSTFKLNGVPIALLSEVVNFSPSTGPGTYTFNYEVTTGNGCNSSITKTIEVLPSPVANFTVSKYCDGDIIDFIANSDPNAVEYEWNFGDNSPIELGANVTHQYATTGSFTVTLTLRSAPVNGITCISTLSQIVDVGSFPNADFTFSNVCEGETTIFSPSADISIAEYMWDFGDGSSTVVSSNPTHVYNNVGTYDVVMTASTSNGCSDVITRRISILPNLAPDPVNFYSMAEIDGGKGGWEERDGNENLNSIWEFGIPQGTLINSDEPAWVTNLSGNYGSNENAFVLSPCFDLSAFQRPVISLDYWSDTQKESDGTVFQYSTDGGISWQTLGSIQNGVSTGLNWYNQSGITGNPGGQQLVGWSRAGDTQWVRARHALDDIPLPRDNVRFRVAFGSNGDTELEGFAFKNVKIEERNKVVLLEHFTNSGTQTAADNYVRNFGSSTSEVVKLEYRTNFPSADPFNSSNPADNDSRVAYYGITSSPASYLDGKGENSLISTGWGNLLFSRQTLTTSPFDINLNTDIQGDVLEVTASIVATTTLEDENSVLHIVLAQRDASGSDFIYQMVKMAPNAAGTKLKSGAIINAGESFEVTLPIQITQDMDPTLTAVIGFLQNEDTKEVYQTTIQNITNLPPTITSTIDLKNDLFNLYPNPANSQVTIVLGTHTSDNVEIYDSFGKLVYSKTIDQNDRILNVNTQDLAAGLYHVQLRGKDNQPIRKRLMIMHRE